MTPTHVRTLGHALLVETVLYATVLMDLLESSVKYLLIAVRMMMMMMRMSVIPAKKLVHHSQ